MCPLTSPLHFTFTPTSFTLRKGLLSMAVLYPIPFSICKVFFLCTYSLLNTYTPLRFAIIHFFLYRYIRKLDFLRPYYFVIFRSLLHYLCVHIVSTFMLYSCFNFLFDRPYFVLSRTLLRLLC